MAQFVGKVRLENVHMMAPFGTVRRGGGHDELTERADYRRASDTIIV